MAKTLPKEIIELSDLFSSMPGIGPKLSRRLALHMGVEGKGLAELLSNKLADVKESIRLCDRCGNVCTGRLCPICEDETRDQSVVLVVEDPLDLYNIEQTEEFSGIYHVLNGVISPVNGVGPEDIGIEKLIGRLKDEEIKELIFGLNPNLEGDSTSLYIKNEIEELGLDIQMSKLAKGIPVGGDLEFLSPQTIADSMKRRNEF